MARISVLTYVARKIASIESEAVYVTTPSLTFGTRSGSEGSLSATLGEGLKSPVDNQTVIGAYNIEDTGDDYAFIIGNGSADNARSNALTVDWSGGISGASATLSDTMTVGRAPTSNMEVATKQYVDSLGFAGMSTLLESGTLTSSTVQRTLDDSIDNYKFIAFVCIIGNFRGTLTMPVTLFKDSTSGYQVVTVRNGTTDTRYGFFRYNSATSINRYCTVNNGLNYQIYGIK